MKKSILIADDDADIAELLARHCQRRGLDVDTASNAMTALGKIEEQRPDLVILDVDMPSGNGLSVCEMMATHEELASIPIIMLTSSRSEDVIRRCHQLCAYYVLKSPDVWSRVEPLLDELLGAADSETRTTAQQASRRRDVPREGAWRTDAVDAVFAVLGLDAAGNLLAGDAVRQPADAEPVSTKRWVLSIEDDDDFAHALELKLRSVGIEMVRAAEGRAGYRQAFWNPPQAILLDYELPEGNGDYVLRRLKETPATSNIPVIVLTGHRERTLERRMRALGAQHFLQKPFQWEELRAALESALASRIAC